MNAQPANRPGTAMAALLDQVPAPLAAQIRDAFASDLIYVSGISLTAGQQTVLNALEKHTTRQDRPCKPWCTDHDSDTDVCRHETLYVDFTGPGQTPWGSTGMTAHADEEPQAFVEFPGMGAAYMTVGDLRALATAALKLTDTAGGAR